MKGVLLLQGDARHIPMPDKSVDLIVTSPPYFALRSYRDGDEHYDGQIGSEPTPQEFLEALWACTAEWQRVLKDEGSLWVNLGDKMAGSGGHNNSGISGGPSQLEGRSQRAVPVTRRNGISDKSTLSGNGHVGGVAKDGSVNKIKETPRASRRSAPDRYNQASGGIRTKSLMGLPWLYALGCIGAWPFPGPMAGPERWILRSEVIWHKANGMPESVTDRVRRNHEQWFHLVKQGSYFSGIDEIREPYSPDTAKRYAQGYNEREIDGQRLTVNTKLGGDAYGENPLGKMPGSVWRLPSEPLIISEADQKRHNLTDHYAAFPTELPRRIILGWSPSGICTVCGDGRRPVATKVQRTDHVQNAKRGRMDGTEPDGNSRGINAKEGRHVSSVEANIVGYYCACTPRTSHRGKRGDWKEGREEVAEQLADDWHLPGASVPRRPGGFGTTTPAPERPMIEYHLDRWAPPPTRPAIVLDPFSGTGTTVGVARSLGRLGVGVDLSFDYCRLGMWRVGKSNHFDKVVNRTNRERQGVLL